MTIDVRKVGRGSLAAATFALITIGGLTYWQVTRDGEVDSELVLVPVDAGTDAPPDAFVPDSPIDAPPVTTWTVVTLASGTSTGLAGFDGIDIADIGSNRVAISPCEQSGSILVLTRSGITSGTWSPLTLSTVVNTEDAKFCDVDSDGAMDIMAGGQGKRIRIWFGPAPWSTTIEIDAATAQDQQWLQLACTTTGGVRIWGGGRKSGTTGQFGYFTSATPRTANSYTFIDISRAAWLMSILPGDYDGDGDLDVVITDRQPEAGLKGSRMFRDDGGGTYSEVVIHNSNNEGDPKFGAVADTSGSVAGDDTVFVGMSSATKPNLVKKSVATSAAWSAFTTTTAFTYPSNMGQYQAIALCDLTGDGTADYVLTHSTADGSLEGVAAVDGASGSTIHIEQEAEVEGIKYDDVRCLDYEGDGDLDVWTTEQNVDENGAADGKGLGVLVFINPRLQ